MHPIAERLRSHLSQQGLSIPDAARIVGISENSLRAVLSGSAVPNRTTMAKYATFLGISIITLELEAMPLRVGDGRGRRPRQRAL